MRRDDRRGGAQQLMGGPYLLAVSLCRRFTQSFTCTYSYHSTGAGAGAGTGTGTGAGTLPDNLLYPDNLPVHR